MNVATEFQCRQCSQLVGRSEHQYNINQESGLILLLDINDCVKSFNKAKNENMEVGVYKNLQCLCGAFLGWFYLTASLDVTCLSEMFVLQEERISKVSIVEEAEAASTPAQTYDPGATGDEGGGSPLDSGRASPKVPECYADRKEWAEDFRKFLEEKEVSSTSNWKMAQKALEADPRFARFRSLPERKKLFNLYKTQRVKAERERERNRVRRARADLERFLLGPGAQPLVAAGAGPPTFARSERLFSAEAAWKAVPAAERRDVVEDALRALLRRERERARAQRHRNTQRLASLLSDLRVSTATTWQDAQQLLLQSPGFATSPELLAMDKEDALAVFEAHVRRQERAEAAAEQERREERRRKLFRANRKARDDFLLLLGELKAAGKLSALSLWQETLPDFSDDPRYSAMINGSRGSTPLDLFKLYVEDLKERYHKDKRIIKKILKDSTFTLKSKSPLEDFQRAVESDSRAAAVDSSNVKLAYLSQLHKLRRSRRH